MLSRQFGKPDAFQDDETKKPVVFPIRTTALIHSYPTIKKRRLLYLTRRRFFDSDMINP